MTKAARLISFIALMFLFFSCGNNFQNKSNGEKDDSKNEILEIHLSEDGFYYSQNNVEISIHGIEDSNSLIKLVIPEKIAGKKVTKIADEAFKGNHRLIEVVLPDTIEEIGEDAFAGCKYLEKINLPEGLRIIDSAFEYSGLKSISVPSTITSASNAFYSCDNLNEVTLADGLKCLPNFGWTAIEEIVIPDSVTTIPDRAFYRTPLKKVKMPASLETIGWDVFYETEILELEIPEGMTNVPSNYFSGPVEEVVIPSTVKKLGETLFRDCYNLTKITINCDLTVDVFNESGINSPFDQMRNAKIYWDKAHKDEDRTKFDKLEIVFGPEVKTVAVRMNYYDSHPTSIDFCNVEEIANNVIRLGSPENPLETFTLPSSIKRLGKGNIVYAKNFVFTTDFEFGDYPFVPDNIGGGYGSTIINSPYVEVEKELSYEDWVTGETITYTGTVYEYEPITITFEEGITKIPEGFLLWENSGSSSYDFEEIEKFYEKSNYDYISSLSLPSTLTTPVEIVNCNFSDSSVFEGNYNVPISFYNCTFSDKLDINENNNKKIDNLSSCAFKEVVLNADCSEINFEYCYIDDVSFQSNLGNIDDYTYLFKGCVLNKVNIEEGGNLSNVFARSRIKKINFSDEITHLDSSFAPVCEFCSDIDLNKIVHIGEYAFNGAYGDSTIHFGTIPTKVSAYSFSGCNLYFDFKTPISFTSDASYAFKECKMLTENPGFTGNNTELPSYFFKGCENLTKVNLLGLTKMNGTELEDCPNIGEFIIDNESFKFEEGILYNIYTKDTTNIVKRSILYTDSALIPSEYEILEIPEDIELISGKSFYGCKVEKLFIYGNCTVGADVFRDGEIHELTTYGSVNWNNEVNENKRFNTTKIVNVYPASVPEGDVQYCYLLPYGCYDSYGRTLTGFRYTLLKPEELHLYMYDNSQIKYRETDNDNISLNTKIYIHCYDAAVNPDGTYEKQKAFYEDKYKKISNYSYRFTYVLPDGTEITK